MHTLKCHFNTRVGKNRFRIACETEFILLLFINYCTILFICITTVNLLLPTPHTVLLYGILEFMEAFFIFFILQFSDIFFCLIQFTVEAIYWSFSVQSLYSLAPEFPFFLFYGFSLLNLFYVLFSWFCLVICVFYSSLRFFETIILNSLLGRSKCSIFSLKIHTHTHTHTRVYIYTYLWLSGAQHSG